MEENRFSEKESLELISRMLKQTKRNMELGSGNIFLYYGYSAVAISLVVFALLQWTHDSVWAALWLLMFLPALLIRLKASKQKPKVVTYMDKAIDNTWSVIGSLFALTFIAIGIIGWSVGRYYFVLMLPLSLLYAGIGISITGVITQVRTLMYTPLFAFAVAIYMLVCLRAGEEATMLWHLLFGFSFLVMMVVPGHVLNKNSRHYA